MWAFIKSNAAVQANAWTAAHKQLPKKKRKGHRPTSLQDRIVLSEQQLHDLSAHLGKYKHQHKSCSDSWTASVLANASMTIAMLAHTPRVQITL